MRTLEDIEEDNENKLGNNIRKYREIYDMSQSMLAGLILIDRTSISRYEKGKRLPDIFTLCRIADIFQISLDTLVGRDNDPQ